MNIQKIYNDFLLCLKGTSEYIEQSKYHNLSQYDILGIFFYRIYHYNYNDINKKNIKECKELTYSEIKSRYYDLNFSHLHNFPLNLTIGLCLSNLYTRNVAYNYYLHIEVVKFMYSIIPKYKTYTDIDIQHLNYPDNEYAKLVKLYIKNISETAMLDSNEYDNIMYDNSNPNYNPKRNSTCYTWWLYCYYPLIDNGLNLLLKLVKFIYINGLQSPLLYGIYQMNSNDIEKFIKPLLTTCFTKYNRSYITRQCFYMDSGAYSEIKDILIKLYKDGYYDCIKSLDDIFIGQGYKSIKYYLR